MDVCAYRVVAVTSHPTKEIAGGRVHLSNDGLEDPNCNVLIITEWRSTVNDTNICNIKYISKI